MAVALPFGRRITDKKSCLRPEGSPGALHCAIVAVQCKLNQASTRSRPVLRGRIAARGLVEPSYISRHSPLHAGLLLIAASRCRRGCRCVRIVYPCDRTSRYWQDGGEPLEQTTVDPGGTTTVVRCRGGGLLLLELRQLLRQIRSKMRSTCVYCRSQQLSPVVPSRRAAPSKWRSAGRCRRRPGERSRASAVAISAARSPSVGGWNMAIWSPTLSGRQQSGGSCVQKVCLCLPLRPDWQTTTVSSSPMSGLPSTLPLRIGGDDPGRRTTGKVMIPIRTSAECIVVPATASGTQS